MQFSPKPPLVEGEEEDEETEVEDGEVEDILSQEIDME